MSGRGALAVSAGRQQMYPQLCPQGVGWVSAMWTRLVQDKGHGRGWMEQTVSCPLSMPLPNSVEAHPDTLMHETVCTEESKSHRVWQPRHALFASVPAMLS